MRGRLPFGLRRRPRGPFRQCGGAAAVSASAQDVDAGRVVGGTLPEEAPGARAWALSCAMTAHAPRVLHDVAHLLRRAARAAHRVGGGRPSMTPWVSD